MNEAQVFVKENAEGSPAVLVQAAKFLAASPECTRSDVFRVLMGETQLNCVFNFLNVVHRLNISLVPERLYRELVAFAEEDAPVADFSTREHPDGFLLACIYEYGKRYKKAA